MCGAPVAIIEIAGRSIPVVASAAGERHIHLATKVVAAGISTNQATYKVHDSQFGDGAGVQTVTVKGSGGTDSEITHCGNVTARSKGTFKIGAPDVNGVASLTGSGHDVSGTGNAKGPEVDLHLHLHRHLQHKDFRHQHHAYRHLHPGLIEPLGRRRPAPPREA